MDATKSLKYQLVSIDTRMNTQVNIRFPAKLLVSTQKYAKKQGFSNIQEFIKETVREKIFDKPEFSKEEVKLIEKFAKACDKHKLYGTEEDLWKALRRK